MATLAAPGSAFGSPGWSPPVAIGASTAVSCASHSFCVAVGGEDAVTFNGTSWGSPAVIDAGASLQSVSCPIQSRGQFCAALDANGNAVFFHAGSWGAPVSTGLSGIRPLLGGVSCSSSAFCAAVNGSGMFDEFGNAVVFHGGAWGVPATIDGAALRAVSCPRASFCLAIDIGLPGGAGFGNGIFLNGTSWGTPTTIDHAGTTISVSCSSQSFCAVVDNDTAPVLEPQAHAVLFNGRRHSWSAPRNIHLEAAVASVSCASDHFCAAVSSFGNAVTFNGLTWSTRVNVNGGQPLSSVSCPQNKFCAAVGSGFVSVYH